MGWSYCGERDDGEPIGYSVDATCEHPNCNEKIDRGVSYACGGMHGNGTYSCDKYFCEEHRCWHDYAKDEEDSPMLCKECFDTLNKMLIEDGSFDDKEDDGEWEWYGKE